MKKEFTSKRKSSIIGLIVFVLYFIYTFAEIFPLKMVGIDYAKMSITAKTIYLLGYEFLFILILFFIYRKDFISNFKDFFKNFKQYVKEYFKYWLSAFGLMILSNLMIVMLFPDSVATNQEVVNDIFAKAPIYMFISGAIFAPMIEETIFRLSIRKIFHNDILFIVISGLIFGSLHVVGSFQQLIDLIYIIPYSIPGFIFAYTLVKSDNIAVPISLHFFHNSFTMIMQAILMFLV